MPSNLTEAERSQRATIAAHESWGRTQDRSARTAPARAARFQRFLDKARENLGPDATDAQVNAAAENLQKAHFARLAYKSARVRRRKAAG